ncbi:GPO family capsid scaffolding protein [Enterobacter cloacae subsp. cloacae]|nr:GPO family capsid scaffolding protein [Enterobacter cloacae subsp. cloacae]
MVSHRRRGDTCDSRVISGDDIQDMADSFDPRVCGCRINLEHIQELMPDSQFKRYGDVIEQGGDYQRWLCARWQKSAVWQIQPLEELVSMVKAGQKVLHLHGDPRTLPTAVNVTSLAWQSPMTRQNLGGTEYLDSARREDSPVKPAGRRFLSPHWLSWVKTRSRHHV